MIKNYCLRMAIGMGLLVLGAACTSTSQESPDATPEVEEETSTAFDWQGHRGARGLVAENTIPAFLKALEYPIQTLELDVVITKDSQVVVSHEPWMSPGICYQPNEEEIPEGQESSYNILQMTYLELSSFNCGKKHKGFPEQEEIEVAKPLLAEVIDAVENYCEKNGRKLPFYNVEIKSQPNWDNVFTPEPKAFAPLVLGVIREKEIADRTCIQSFDPRSLEVVHRLQPDLTTAYLVGQVAGVEKNLQDLSYVPEVYSPNYRLVSKNMVDTVHAKGMRVVPWTVNETALMEELKGMGVDGIITDYPNRIPF